ncbi:unnamed protein product [Clonostachys rosea f. rosea IK726]|uniref:ubiquitinyl hydrolase 1 n=2 Tax=Bionectria ochroleuca TaxID=29856 RepID=A0A0B7KH56_BIOOC|nr:unnamed protein product [Clonostachys rosea f. rosea IK726]
MEEKDKKGRLEAIFDHLVLPAQISDPDPTGKDEGLALGLGQLLRRSIALLLDGHKNHQVWSALQSAVNSTLKIQSTNAEKESLIAAFTKLGQEADPRRAWLALHVAKQNAGLIIHKHSPNDVVFEAFHASPPTALVLKATHAIAQDFPDRAVGIPIETFKSSSFRENLATFLEQATKDSFERFAARAHKAGRAIVETRDSSSPALISEMLMSLLEGLGQSQQVPILRKKVRDDVVLAASEAPWRRSPTWLVLRVFIRRHLTSLLDKDHRQDSGVGRIYYKFLIAVMLAKLLETSVGVLHPEKITTLLAKLSRRLAKLQSEREASEGAARLAYDSLLGQTKNMFLQVTTDSKARVKSAWERYKKSITRLIPRLPRYADASDFRLRLESSGPKLQGLLSQVVIPTRRPMGLDVPTLEGTVCQINDLATEYTELHDFEAQLGSDDLDPESRCEMVAEDIIAYIKRASVLYKGDSVLMSQCLLRLFELWIAMDEAAAEIFPGLLDLHPVFVPHMLDVLCLPKRREMSRLQRVQQYIKDRVAGCLSTRTTIFGDPESLCAFPLQFFHSTKAGAQMAALGAEIDHESMQSRLNTEATLESLTIEYHELTDDINASVCTCTYLLDGTKDVRGCERCYKWRCRNRLKVAVHEAFLPSGRGREGQRAAILLELQLPKFIDAYREATWSLIVLGTPDVSSFYAAEGTPTQTLKDLGQLEHWFSTTSGSLILASMKKSILNTHYRSRALPAQVHEVILPFGPKFSYYDSVNNIWTSQLESRTPNYQRLLGSYIPHPQLIIDPYTHDQLLNQELYPPSSYDIAASEADCTPDISFKELSAFQRAISGRGRRWIVLLIELAASNVNFSSQAAMNLLIRLAIQAGPNDSKRNDNNVLREAHSVFNDAEFCEQLYQQLIMRLEAISMSWREVFFMNILISFSLRLLHLCPQGLEWMPQRLLARARDAISDWIVRLRDDVRSTNDPSSAQKAAMHAFQASLLCRKICLELMADTHNCQSCADKTNTRCFLRASIAMQEHLVVDLNQITAHQRLLLGQDLYESYKLRNLIEESLVEVGMQCLDEVINETWPTGGQPRSYLNWTFLAGPQRFWVASHASSNLSISRPQVVHFHILQGHLLVDGKPLGRLPLSMREDEAIKELFGHRYLLTRSSSLAGMEYQLASDVEGHTVHFGLKDTVQPGLKEKRVIIKAVYRGQALEYVNRDIFRPYDLPSTLIDDCFHWLNSITGEVEIRRKVQPWRQKQSNWVLNIKAREARRNTKKFGGSRLIDPRSDIGGKIAGILRGFEDQDKLTIYAPANGVVNVELKRLELAFFVNKHKLLQSGQLQCEIDPNQDIGTFHGLESGIVLRNVHNFDQRSVILPMGATQWQRRGMHMAVTVLNCGEYCRYTVNSLLGRLECPPEPALLFLKAHLHALTSFVLPDQLTGRTGTEEALFSLGSASCQPWTELPTVPQNRLMNLKQSLVPRRVYYPPDKAVCQKIFWDQNLTSTIQHDALKCVVEKILLQSRILSRFNHNIDRLCDGSTEVPSTQDHLVLRGIIRRNLYERPCDVVKSLIPSQALQPIYFDTQAISSGTSKESRRVYSIMKGLRPDCMETHSTYLLEPMTFLSAQPSIGGFTPGLRNINVAELLDNPLIPFWGTLVQTCRRGIEEYQVIFMLAIIAFGKNVDAHMLKWLVKIATSQQLRSVIPPAFEVAFIGYETSGVPDGKVLDSLILRSNTQNMHATRPGQKGLPGGRDSITALEATRLASRILTWWCTGPNLQEDVFKREVKQDDFRHLNVQGVWKSLEPELDRVHRNVQLHQYIMQLEKLAKAGGKTQKIARSSTWELNCSPGKLSPFTLEGEETVYEFFELPTLSGHLSRKEHTGLVLTWAERKEELGIHVSSPGQELEEQFTDRDLINASKELSILDGVTQGLIHSSDSTRQQYGNDLRQSLLALARNENTSSSTAVQPAHMSLGKLVMEISDTKNALSKQASSIHESIRAGEACYSWLWVGGLWAIVTPVALLELLQRDTRTHLRPEMLAGVVSYGLLITKLQRLLRIQDAMYCNHKQRLDEEYTNQPHTNWNPMENPEWLLLEIDNDILIRRSQVDVARAIISPASGNNSVLQMNMGQGKTSCILPMAAAVLANKQELCRIIVPRALLHQTAQVIQSRLSRLIGRVVTHIPFSRRTPTKAQFLGHFREIHENALACGGIMLCLPEHILSFKLSGLQRLSDGKLDEAEHMINIQQWLNESCRDILDESDFMLAPRVQLIYPSGPQTIVDGHPYRWQITEEILSFVENHVSYLQLKYSDGLHIVRRHHAFPILHFLHTEVQDALNSLLIDDICNGRLSTVELKVPGSEEAQRDLRDVLTPSAEPSTEVWKRACQHLADDFGYNKLLLLRGLVSQRILLLCLKKRWNVQFGITPIRPPIAVPFEAKGIPSQTAEYGHPDTAIVLTCLAFYQTGLSVTQIEQSLKYIIKMADPSVGFETWIQDCNDLPAALRHWSLINADDVEQVSQLWQHLRFNRNVINQYMNTFVFPAHAKQFSLKLQASGWDIPLFSKDKITKPRMSKLESISSIQERNLTTGFSGTNDNRRMLPDNIRQEDLPSLLQTNAQVLKYLVETRNQECLLAQDKYGRQLSEIDLLKLLHSKGIRVLIDSGAYILERENHEVASAWLEVDFLAQAVVYFGQNSQIMVRARSLKNPMPLLASPFANDLKDCLVYIDEAHTRGTDLKLPVFAKGALTLGLGQTKDHTVQGAMRLRQLGSTQSIAFVAPPEVYRSIMSLESRNKTTSKVNSIDVVRWLLEQSCKTNDQMMSLHISQGLDYCRRTNEQWKATKSLTDRVERIRLLRAIREKEDQTLEQLYGPRANTETNTEPIEIKSSRLKSVLSRIAEKRATLSKEAASGDSTAFQEVEQEREVEFEVEQVRERQRPEKLQALAFPGVSEQLVQFVRNGDLPDASTIVQAFAYLGNTVIGKKYDVRETSSQLFVSKQFTKTVASGGSNTNRGLVRPVEWILWYPDRETGIIVIPEEAELLLPVLRGEKQPIVWLLSYSAPLTRHMCIFNRLNFFTVPSPPNREFKVPRWMTLEVGIVSARLYFGWLEYKGLLAWLGMAKGAKGEGTASQCGGLYPAEARKFLLDWLSHCHNTFNILHTPVGFVAQGKELRHDHSFFGASSLDEADVAAAAQANGSVSSKRVGKGLDGALDDDSDDDSDWGIQQGDQGEDESSAEEDSDEMDVDDSEESSEDEMSIDEF